MREYIVKCSDEFVKQMKDQGMTDEFELIRCKDCKKRAFGRWCGNYPTFQPEVSDDHYCGYAERRTE